MKRLWQSLSVEALKEMKQSENEKRKMVSGINNCIKPRKQKEIDGLFSKQEEGLSMISDILISTTQNFYQL